MINGQFQGMSRDQMQQNLTNQLDELQRCGVNTIIFQVRGEADALYDRAMDAMARAPHGALEQAITCLNRANLVEARDGLEAGERAINALVERAAELLHRDGLDHDGYYAFVCEKCAPTFDYYGYFLVAGDLNERAKEIYERA